MSSDEVAQLFEDFTQDPTKDHALRICDALDAQSPDTDTQELINQIRATPDEGEEDLLVARVTELRTRQR